MEEAAVAAMEGKYPFVTHGSPDSLDLDRVYFFPALPSFRECQLFCSSKEDNRNIYVVKDGVVAATFKGLPDECNNSIIFTYPLHPQEHPLPITRRVLRIAPLKATRAIRGLLTRLTKTKYRTVVKPILKETSFTKRTNCLASIDFAATDMNYEDMIEDCKAIAWQIGQTRALLEGVELYTKGDLSDYLPDLRPFLQRDDEDVPELLANLNTERDFLVQILQNVEIEEHGVLNLFKKWGPLTAVEDKQLKERKEWKVNDPVDFAGLIVDMKAERVVLFPPEVKESDLVVDGEKEVVGSFYVHDGKVHFATKDSLEPKHRGKKVAVKEQDQPKDFDHEKLYGLWVVNEKEEDGEHIFFEVKQLVGLRDKLTSDLLPLEKL